MALSRIFSPVLHFDDDKGHPLAGGWLCTYIAGTNTPVATFKDAAGTPNETEIQLDSRGECEVWLDASVQYKFALYDSTKTVPIWTKDNIIAPGVGIEPGTGKVVVAGTSPVTVTPHTVNGITTYMVALEQSFIDDVANNKTAIANEIERATTEESTLSGRIETVNDTLSERITDETNRAQTAEVSARTVVRAGEGIQVSKIPDQTDGHDEYWVSTYLPEATSTRFGVVKTGSDTVQVIPKNEPSRNKHRTYPVQKNADGQMVVNVPWKNDAKHVYKGIVTVKIQGSCIDTVDPVTEVASKVVSDTFADAEIFPAGDNQITSVTYLEVDGKTPDAIPEFHVDNQGHLYYTFDNESQDHLVFDMLVHFTTMQGFDYMDDGVIEFVANSAFVPQPLMAINQSIPVKKTVDGVGEKILDNGIILVVPKSNNLGSAYDILLRAEYWYTCSPPEFFVFDAVDDEGDYMVDDEGDRMVIYEDNPDYVGA